MVVTWSMANNIESELRTIFTADSEEELEPYLEKARQTAWRVFGKRIHFYAPSFMYYKTSYYRSSPSEFPTISVTGKGCSLNCGHCGGKILETMYPATTPEELFALSERLKQGGALGCLISGGCLPDGSVPLGEFVDVIAKIKRELGLTVFAHTGIVSPGMAKRLAEAKVDAILIDVLGSNETLKEICDLDVSVRDYEDSLRALQEAGVPFVPHVIAGLHYGKLKGELTALEMISRHDPSAVVVIALMPIHGTRMESVEPSKPLDIAKVIAVARLAMPETPLVLGCMRPKGRHRLETDSLAIRAGVNAVAFPAEETIEYAKSQGYAIVFSSFCCAQAYLNIKGSGNNVRTCQ